jgi:hypothetical protein
MFRFGDGRTIFTTAADRGQQFDAMKLRRIRILENCGARSRAAPVPESVDD